MGIPLALQVQAPELQHQVFGGHGYVREWGIEQIVRDVRVAMIYEGSNEIQAQDLLFRKVLADKGIALREWIEQLLADMPEGPAGDLARSDLETLGALGEAVVKASAQSLYPVAGDFLRCTTLALMSWAWSLLATRGGPQLLEGQQAFTRWVRPEFAMRVSIVRQSM